MTRAAGAHSNRRAQASRYADEIIRIRTEDDSFTDLLFEVSDGTLSEDRAMVSLIWKELERRGKDEWF